MAAMAARAEARRAGSAIADAERIGVVTHERPDGDAVGALLGTSLALQNLAKQVFPAMADGLPSRFSFLPGSDSIQSGLPQTLDLLIALDCSDLGRLGPLAGHLPRPVDVNIDHHPTNEGFGAVNFVIASAASTAGMIFEYASDLGLPLDRQVATCLLTGLVTDTLGFRTENVTPHVLRQAADLQQLGAPLAEIYERSLGRFSFRAARYWGCGLSSLQREQGMVWAMLTLEDRKAAGYGGPDDADLINFLSTIDGARIAMIFVEQTDLRTKISWRSRDSLDVSKVAAVFGGGGHRAAAGAVVQGKLPDVLDRVLSATRQLLQGATISAEPD
jgi:phosphoesterase RecJ-like protein